MSSKIREWLFETAKFASAVVTYLLLSDLPWKLDFAGKIVEAAIEATLASTVAFIFWGFLVGRPVVELQWRTADTPHPESGRLTLDPEQLFNLQVYVHGESWVCWLIRMVTRNQHLWIEVDLQPHGSHLVVIQSRQHNSPLTPTPTRTGVTVGEIDLKPGIKASAQLQIIRDGPSIVSTPLDVRVTEIWKPDSSVKSLRLLNVKLGTDGIDLRRD